MKFLLGAVYKQAGYPSTRGTLSRGSKIARVYKKNVSGSWVTN